VLDPRALKVRIAFLPAEVLSDYRSSVEICGYRLPRSGIDRDRNGARVIGRCFRSAEPDIDRAITRRPNFRWETALRCIAH